MMDDLGLLLKANEFVAQLREAVAAIHRPFSTCETAYLSNLLSARQHSLLDLHRERGDGTERSPIAAPSISLRGGVMALPKEHTDFVDAWDRILNDAVAEVEKFRDFAKTL